MRSRASREGAAKRGGRAGRSSGPRRSTRASFALAAALGLAPAPASAFSVFAAVCGPSIHPCGSPENPLDVRATLEATPRWSAAPIGGRGLHDGLQVGVAPGAASAFGFAGAAGNDQFQALVQSAFAVWESPVLSFEIAFEAAGVVPDVGGSGYEIDFHAVSSSDPLFGDLGFFGVAYDDFALDPGRRLTNGAAAPGTSIRGADVFVATDRIDTIARLLGLSFQARADFLQRVLIHEIGHTLGLHHPNVDPGANLDDDGDPLTRVTVDPLDPFAGLRVSTNVDWDAVMSNSPRSYEAGFFTALRADDLSGRDVLYPLPVPEPASGLLAAAGFLALAGRRRARGDRRLLWARCRGVRSSSARARCASPRSTRSAT